MVFAFKTFGPLSSTSESGTHTPLTGLPVSKSRSLTEIECTAGEDRTLDWLHTDGAVAARDANNVLAKMTWSSLTNCVVITISNDATNCGGGDMMYKLLVNEIRAKVPTWSVCRLLDRQGQDRERDYASPACSLITLRGSLSSRNPANFAWRKWSTYASYCTSPF